MTIRKYAAKQGIISGICTFVLCGILFFFMVKTDMELSHMFLDIGLTVGCTGFICGLLQVFSTKGPVKKGLVPPAGSMENQAAYLMVPNNAYALLIWATIVEVLLFAFAPLGIIAMMGGTLPRMSYIVVKAALAAFAACYATYHANIFVCALHQEKLTPAAK